MNAQLEDLRSSTHTQHTHTHTGAVKRLTAALAHRRRDTERGGVFAQGAARCQLQEGAHAYLGHAVLELPHELLHTLQLFVDALLLDLGRLGRVLY